MAERFEIITEADARQIAIGATVELAKGGHVTPLAADTLRERRVTVVPAGSVDPAIPPDLAPKAQIARVAIASDHTGIAMRKAIVQHLRGRAIAVDDLGVDGTAPADYPDIAARVAKAVARGEADAGIVIDDENDRSPVFHAGTSEAGSVSMKQAPRGVAGSYRTLPP